MRPCQLRAAALPTAETCHSFAAVATRRPHRQNLRLSRCHCATRNHHHRRHRRHIQNPRQGRVRLSGKGSHPHLGRSKSRASRQPAARPSPAACVHATRGMLGRFSAACWAPPRLRHCAIPHRRRPKCHSPSVCGPSELKNCLPTRRLPEKRRRRAALSDARETAAAEKARASRAADAGPISMSPAGGRAPRVVRTLSWVVTSAAAWSPPPRPQAGVPSWRLAVAAASRARNADALARLAIGGRGRTKAWRASASSHRAEAAPSYVHGARGSG